MKILELTLTNFLPILSGMGKETVTIDLRNDSELINVFIGKVGSGKTYLLSHLQPFATVGTLDVRNSDDPIIKEKDGKKVIIYEKDNHEYIITHDYLWTGKTHSKKSYIEKDGVELNENGNSNSFKEIIQLEFGIDQSFLRLLRLGPNVINFINMKATERKSYIASLLDDTELYLLLYKHWTNELRTLNTSSNILMNKLNNYGDKPIQDLEDDLSELEDKASKIKEKLDELSKRKYALNADIANKLQGKTYSEYLEYKKNVEIKIGDSTDSISKIKEKLEKYKEYPDITEVSKIIGQLDAKITMTKENIENTTMKCDELSNQLLVLNDKKAISKNDEYIRTLKDTHKYLLEMSLSLEKDLEGFDCKYNESYLSNLLNELETINITINEILQYDADIIRHVYHSDDSIISFSKKKVEVLGYRKIKVQKMINNMKFSETYEATTPLYFPPFCPTKNCPYYQTHPDTIQKKTGNKSSIEDKIKEYQIEIQELDVEIYKYSDYPILYSKINSLKQYWKNIKGILQDINALNQPDLLQIITIDRYKNWYNYTKIIDTIELIKKREQYFDVTSRLNSINKELNELEETQNDSLDSQIKNITNDLNKMYNDIENMEESQRESEERLASMNEMYLELSEQNILENNLRTKDIEYRELKDEYNIICNNIDNIEDTNQTLIKLKSEIDVISVDYKSITNQIDELRVRINDMKYTNDELDKVLTEQKYMTYMVDAVSSKKGIPLIMIQIFLNSCRDIVNDLIYDICEDDIEILPFKINDTEFKIPYMVNGQVIDDISKASQGQTSIVSTAMSFALVRQTGNTHYNIPLLDEMDAALHKNDKQKFMSILLKHLKEIGSEQCFLITHNNVFDGYPVQVIMTTDELVNEEKYTNIIKL